MTHPIRRRRGRAIRKHRRLMAEHKARYERFARAVEQVGSAAGIAAANMSGLVSTLLKMDRGERHDA